MNFSCREAHRPDCTDLRRLLLTVSSFELRQTKMSLFPTMALEGIRHPDNIAVRLERVTAESAGNSTFSLPPLVGDNDFLGPLRANDAALVSFIYRNTSSGAQIISTEVCLSSCPCSLLYLCFV
jgi:hypothetical protein